MNQLDDRRLEDAIRTALQHRAASISPVARSLEEPVRDLRRQSHPLLLAAAVVAMLVTATALGIGFWTNSESSTSPVSSGHSGRSAEFDVGNLTAALEASNNRPTKVETVKDASFPGADHATRLCVAGIQVSAYEYPSERERRAVSQSIDPHGSPVGGAYIEWRGPPRFYARGRVLVLVLSDENRVNATLTAILGPTLTPKAAAEPAFARRTECGAPTG